MLKRIALIATLLLLTCGGGEDDIDVSVSISDIANITTTSATVTVRYTAGNVSITQVGVVYGATAGRLNIATIINSSGTEPDENYGIVFAPASVSGHFDADLTNLADGTEYFIAPFVKLETSSPEFPEGYFLPSGYKTFRTNFATGSNPPAVSVTSISGITHTSVNVVATIGTIGSPRFEIRGFCYGTSPDPIDKDGNSTCTPAFGSDPIFSESIIDLSGNTAYYVRAYVSNRHHPVQYGQTTGFRTLGGDDMLTDERDGQTYRVTEIGRFTWMAENLNYRTGNSWCYVDDDANCEKYGRLYTRSAAASACPAGWQLPTRFQWNNLIETAGGTATAGGRLKNARWDNGADHHGFGALPGGYRDRAHVRVFVDIETAGRWWFGDGGYWSIRSGNNSVIETTGGDNFEHSVRCVQIRN